MDDFGESVDVCGEGLASGGREPCCGACASAHKSLFNRDIERLSQRVEVRTEVARGGSGDLSQVIEVGLFHREQSGHYAKPQFVVYQLVELHRCTYLWLST